MEVFQPTVLAGMKLKNRIIRAATHEGLGDSRGLPQDELRDIYVRLAKGGAGAIITGYAGVLASGRAWKNMLMIDGDDCVAAFKKLTAAVSPYETPLILQLAHSGGMANAAVTGSDPKAPSKHRYWGGRTTAKELTESEIEEIIAGFVHGIERARQAGFDGVELHAAHGYLLSEFLSPYLNRRQDKWGGTTERRFHIVREIVARARDAVGGYPIIIKISAYDFQSGGMTVDEAVRLAGLIQHATLDAIEVSCGNDDFMCTVRAPRVPVEAILSMEPTFKQASWIKKQLASLLIPRMLKSCAYSENYNLEAAERIKASVDIPVIVVGGVRKYSAISETIAHSKADYVSLCRPFIIDPEIVNKLQTGKRTESGCINCNYCLIGVTDNPLKCYYGKTPTAKQ